MTSSLLLIALLSLNAFEPQFEIGEQLTYEGTLVAEKGEPAETQKKFTCTLLILDIQAGDRVHCAWTIQEDGRGGWGWLRQFGELTTGGRPGAAAGNAPSLRYQRDAGASIVPLLTPLWTNRPALAADQSWQEDKLQYRVVASEAIRGRRCWVVQVSNAYGPKRTLWIDKATPVVLAIQERVFLGQGEAFELLMQLKQTDVLSDERQAKATATLTALKALREKLGIEPAADEAAWTEEQIRVLTEALPKISAADPTDGLGQIVAAANEDLKTKRNQANGVSALEKRIVGKQVPAFQLPELSGKNMGSSDLKGKVTVLHFWEYRDAPLEEPYGQIGYLDFLLRQQKAGNVQVIGVNVDERLADESTRGRSIASAKKLKSFMNLSYPILLDDGEVLKQFGDPRAADAKLPLFVVVAPDGKVVHYHVGSYDVDRLVGLQELNEVVKKAAGTGE